MAVPRPRADNRRRNKAPPLTPKLTNLFEEIQQLLDAPASGAGAPGLDAVEHTLTTGYAEALALEAERWRLERRLGEIAVTIADDGNGTSELRSLATRLTTTDGELTSLRSLLASLRARHSALRVASA
jgi:hypothetical protein